MSGADTTTLRNNATVYAQPLNPDAAVTHLKMPVLYIADSHDGEGPFATDARKLYARTPSAAKRLVVLPGFGHGTAMFATEGTQLQDLILRFIQTSTRR